MKLKLIAVIVSTFIIQSCTNYEPVAVSQCKVVVKHAQKVLGSLSPRRSELMTDCKKASDTERGCVMSSKKSGEILQCF